MSQGFEINQSDPLVRDLLDREGIWIAVRDGELVAICDNHDVLVELDTVRATDRIYERRDGQWWHLFATIHPGGEE